MFKVPSMIKQNKWYYITHFLVRQNLGGGVFYLFQVQHACKMFVQVHFFEMKGSQHIIIFMYMYSQHQQSSTICGQHCLACLSKVSNCMPSRLQLSRLATITITNNKNIQTTHQIQLVHPSIHSNDPIQTALQQIAAGGVVL